METENTNIYRGTKRQRGGERQVGVEEGALCDASQRTEKTGGREGARSPNKQQRPARRKRARTNVAAAAAACRP